MEKIPENTFIYMDNLTYLHLDWNNITSISKYTFEGLSNLKYLYMIRNLLTKIEEGNYVLITKIYRTLLRIFKI